jgi:hypothetical protein
MAIEVYEVYKPKDQTREILHHIINIVKDYSSQGLTLTLRQLYYQLVSKDLISNDEKQYKRIGEVVSKARRGGLLDWEALEDRVRRPVRPPEFDSIDDLMAAALNSYRLPRMKGQDIYVELWVEKDALAGVLYPIANNYHVTMMVNRGYSSTSAMKDAGERIRNTCTRLGCSRAMVLYLGDLDPSGEDMVRDIGERVSEYVNAGWKVAYKDGKAIIEDAIARNKRLPFLEVEVEKLALTMEQVEEYNPPPNPAKRTDSRAPGFIAKFGDSSWEVDALPPVVLKELIEDRLDDLIDSDSVNAIIDQEDKDKKLIAKAVEALKPKPKKPRRARKTKRTP